MCTNACCSTCRYSSFHALYAEISITGIVAVGYEDLAPYFEGPWVLEVDLDCTTCIRRWRRSVHACQQKSKSSSPKETSNSPNSRFCEVQVELKFLMGDSGHI